MTSPDRAVDEQAWALEQVQRVTAKAEELGRELAHLRETVEAQRAETARLQEALAMVEGRTLRHESGQDAARALQQETAALAERVEQEAALRRDLTDAFQRQIEREREQQQDVQRQLERLTADVDGAVQRAGAEQDRARTIAAGIAERDREGESAEGRLAALERWTEADRELLRQAREEQSRLAALLATARQAIDELTAAAGASQREQHRMDDELAAVRTERDREAQLLELVEQQRAVRQRVEERLSAFDSTLEEARRDAVRASEERIMLRQQAAGQEEQLERLSAALQALRDAVVQHFQRLAEASEETGRKSLEEINRVNRRARDLLVRFTEGTDETEREQPL